MAAEEAARQKKEEAERLLQELSAAALGMDLNPLRAAIERAAFPTAGIQDLLEEADLLALCETFPEGGFVALDGDTPVGMGVPCCLPVYHAYPGSGGFPPFGDCLDHCPRGTQRSARGGSLSVPGAGPSWAVRPAGGG